jgi:hypothetical protein
VIPIIEFNFSPHVPGATANTSPSSKRQISRCFSLAEPVDFRHLADFDTVGVLLGPLAQWRKSLIRE